MEKRPKREKEKRIKKVTGQIFDVWQNNDSEFSSDVLGSYTGNPDKDIQPEQDADDL